MRGALVYAALGTAWIVVTDRLVDAIVDDPAVVWIQTAKGAAFVLASALLVFVLIRRFARVRDAAEAELRGSEERFRNLVERVPGIVYLNEVDPTDPSRTRCVYVGPQLGELLGYEPDAWIADDELWQKVIHPDDRGEAVAASEAAEPVGELSFEYRVVARDGRTVWIHDEALRVDGRPAYWLGVMVDITSQRAAEAALHDLSESLRGVFAASPLAIMVLEPDGRVRHWNPAAERMLGWTAAEVVGRPVPFVPHDKQEEFARLRRRVLEGGGFSGIEVTRVRKDGSSIELSVSTAPFYGEGGEVEAIVAVLEDITDRRAAEETRRRAVESQLRLARRIETLHQIDRDVLAATSVEEMADRALEHLRSLVPYDRASVGFLDRASGVYSFLAERASGLGSPFAGVEVSDDQTLGLLARDVVSIPDIAEMPARTPLAASALSLGIRSVLSVALGAEGEQLGNLIVASRTPDAFDGESEDIAREVASQLAIAIRQAWLRDALRERADQLERLAEDRQQLLRRIVRAQEEERERVALELHDGLGQVLTSVSLFASDLEKDVVEAARPRAARVNELIRRAIEDSRQLVWSLRPPELERLGLVPALRRLADDASAREDVEVDLHEEIGDLRLAPETEAVVYRVAQEALHNSQKHARASAVSIVLRRAGGSLSTLIEDNGRGFDPGAVPPGQGMGLIGMRERAELVDGSLVIESREGSGTRVRLEVPMSSARSNGGS